MVASCQLELRLMISFHLRQSLSFNLARWISCFSLFVCGCCCCWGGGGDASVCHFVSDVRPPLMLSCLAIAAPCTGSVGLSECQYCRAWWVKAGSVKLIPTDLGYPALIPGYASSVNRSLPLYVSLRDRTDCTHGPGRGAMTTTSTFTAHSWALNSRISFMSESKSSCCT